ncbi:hypothetical protein [Paenibacillus mesophilus]|uniref:hypothetical protein n=1 Tax=Paenibacillus mesophilus TaxID=2582849 RepID=UPI001EE466F4|nr:hypothetical protein [Paenibacillus mesophilus]
MNNRKDMGLMGKVLLPKPAAFTMQPNTWTTAVSALYGLLESADADFSLPMLMGLTGQAFRINIEPETVNIGGPTIYHYGEILSRGLRNIGFNTTFLYERVNRPEYAERNVHLVDPKVKTEEARLKRSLPDSLPEALSLIHRSLDRGADGDDIRFVFSRI